MPDLDRAAFADWLRSQEPDAVVGVSGWPESCPLARFLTERLHAPCSASHAGYSTGDGYSWRGPVWMGHFAFAVDDGRDRNTPITAADALSLLAEVPE